MKKFDQNGYHVLLVILIIVVVGIVGLVGWRVFGSKRSTQQNTGDEVNTQQPKDQEATQSARWEWNGTKWESSGEAPDCPNPNTFKKSPTDVSKATAVLYPGQNRGGDYKPHGGFRFDGVKNADVMVVAPMDAKLVEASRYIEQGETQILLTFTNDCGISYRFDHLLAVSPAIQAEIDKLPPAKPDDSRTTKFDSPVTVKTGDTIATAVGFKNSGNSSFDFGVYDLRERNKAAQDSAYATKHQDELSQAAYAVCWFDMLPSADASVVKNLPAGDSASGKTSDYCK